MAKKYGLAVHLPEGRFGYLTAQEPGDPKPALFATAEEANKELVKRKRDKSYSWSLPVTVEPYVTKKEQEDE